MRLRCGENVAARCNVPDRRENPLRTGERARVSIKQKEKWKQMVGAEGIEPPTYSV